MINSAALLPSLSRSSGLSPRSAIGLNIIRRDSIAVDRLLKERLVLSKVRYGIERQQQERERRRNREADLETDSKQNYEVGDTPNDPRKRRRGIGGLLGNVFGGILSSLGGVAFQTFPAFLLARNKVVKGGTNFNRTIGATDGLLNTIKGQKGPFDTLRKVKLDPVRNIGNTITRFGNSLTLFVNSAIAGQVGGRALSSLRGRAGVRSQVSGRMSTSQIELERQLQNARLRENARARNRAMELQRVREESVAAETAKSKSRSRKKRMPVQVEAPSTNIENYERSYMRRNRMIEREIFGSEFGSSTTATLDKDALRNKSFLRNSFIMDEFDAKRLGFNDIGGDGIFTRGRVQLGNFQIGGQQFYYVDKNNIDFQQYLHTRYGKSYRGIEIDFTNKEFAKAFSIDELESNLGVKARNIAGQDMLIDAMQGGRKSDFNVFRFIDRMAADEASKAVYPRASMSVRQGTVEQPISVDRTSFGKQTGYDAQGKPLYEVPGRTGFNRSKVTVSGRPGQKVFRKSDGTITYRSGGLTNQDLFSNAGERSTRNMFRDMDKLKSKKVVPKKGIGKFLSNIGGAQFLKPVKEFVGQGIKNIPFIGDLIGILLDVFVFGEPIQRALFLAGGSALGAFLGGLAGSIGGPPGALIGGIIGGIAGDLLGGAFYDLLFRRGQKGSAGQRFGASATKASIKAGLYTGGFAGYGTYMLGEGGREFVLDADSTAALERRSPGFLMALNKARGAEAIGVIEDYASYDKASTGKEKMVPIPIPIPQKESPVQEIMMTDSEAGGGTGGGFIAFFSEHYRRG